MTRPLRYDDAFTNILKEKMFDKILGLFTIKVQSTTFFQKYNLQKGLLIASLYDLVFGIIITILLFNNYHHNEGNTTFLLESSLGVLSIFFGLIGLDSALNLKKVNAVVYKNWRIAFTFLYIVIEIGNHFRFICFYSESYHLNMTCSGFERGLFFLILVIWNCYITKIAWSFFIRLDQSHDLLIIHGKYLEKMLSEENFKTDISKKYTPPSENKIILDNYNNNSNVSNSNIDINKKGSAGGIYSNNNSGAYNKSNTNYKIDLKNDNDTSNKGSKNGDLGVNKDFRLFTKESQITSGGNIRDSLNNDLKNN